MESKKRDIKIIACFLVASGLEEKCNKKQAIKSIEKNMSYLFFKNIINQDFELIIKEMTKILKPIKN
jgi:mannitol/fructose-specific phosphotransferase system IIA component (Ntr-type)